MFSRLLLLPPLVAISSAAPTKACSGISNPGSGPIPGESATYSDYRGVPAPYPGTCSEAIMPTVHGPAGPDDLLFQNLLSAEWIVYSFYQYGVETFKSSDFVSLGLPNTTYSRIQEIRDNEAGHLRIFQDEISDSSTKPGPCKYDFGITSATEFLQYLVSIEVGSMIFITGLARQAKLPDSVSALAAVGETESRHNTWALIDVFGVSPFGGPVDTIYPYANQILDITSTFIIPGSCPSGNPVYPTPSQNLPQIQLFNHTAIPGARTQFVFYQPENQPDFVARKSYYSVYNHANQNITVPFDTKTNTSTIPAIFEKNKGAIIMVITDEPGATTQESCVAGPIVIVEQPVLQV